MSISISAYGVPLNATLAIFGSGNTVLVEHWAKALPKDQRDILDRAVAEGVPFSNLQEEDWSHVLLIKRLFENAPDATWGDVTYRHSWLANIMKESTPFKSNESATRLMNYFVCGRPIFGRTFGDTDARYGFLYPNEVLELDSVIQPYKFLEPGNEEECSALSIELMDEPITEFLMALADLLSKIGKREQGLAIYIG